MYCGNCGSKIDPGDRFCSSCGRGIKSELESDEIGSNSHGPDEVRNLKNGRCVTTIHKKTICKSLLKCVWVLTLVCMAGFFLTAYSTLALDSDAYLPDLVGPGTDEAERNVQVCEQIAADYHESHTYTEADVYDCDNMAQDVWNMLKAKGINARIAVGNFDSENNGRIGEGRHIDENLDSGSPGEFEVCDSVSGDSGLLNSDVIESFNHAWVLAEVSPGSWLAVECTGGYVVYSEEDKNYYSGITFSNPRNYRNFLDLYADWNVQSLDYENQRLYYNELVEKYNDASYFDQQAMKSGVEVAENILHEKERVFLQTDAELKALLEYG